MLHPYQVGKPYFIRTVTFYYTGLLKAVHEHELVLEDVAWIADTGRFSEALRTGSFNEVEPYPADTEVIVNRGSIVDASVCGYPLPRDIK